VSQAHSAKPQSELGKEAIVSSPLSATDWACTVQAFGEEKELMDLLRGVEQAVQRTRNHLPIPQGTTQCSADLPALVPMLLQQAEMMERAACVGMACKSQGERGQGTPEFKMFAKEDSMFDTS
jgi:hypothetical protein